MMCEQLVHEASIDNISLKIFVDLEPENPRNTSDPLGTILHWHPRYDLGEQYVAHAKYNSEMGVLKGELGNLKEYIYLPLYLYDHSGITINTTGFHCEWDSGQVGWVYVSRKKAREELGVKRITKSVNETIHEMLKEEVASFDDYLTGNVYSFQIQEDEHVIDSCCGFYGDPKTWITEVAQHVGTDYKDIVIKLIEKIDV